MIKPVLKSLIFFFFLLLFSCSNNNLVIENLKKEIKECDEASTSLTRLNKELQSKILIIQDSLKFCRNEIETQEWGEIKYTHSQVNIRSGRGVSFNKNGILKYGDEVKVDFLKNNWYAIFEPKENERNEGKKKGYIRADLLFDNRPKKQTQKRVDTYTRFEFINLFQNKLGCKYYMSHEKNEQGQNNILLTSEFYPGSEVVVRIYGTEKKTSTIAVFGDLTENIQENRALLSFVSSFADLLEMNSSKWVDRILAEYSKFPSENFIEKKYFGKKEYIISYEVSDFFYPLIKLIIRIE
jgi:hypothetical protein